MNLKGKSEIENRKGEKGVRRVKRGDFKRNLKGERERGNGKTEKEE